MLQCDAASLFRATIFRDLPDDLLGALAMLAQRRSYRARSLLMELEPDTPSIFIIASGRIRVARSTCEGNEVTLAYLCAGDLFEFVAFDDVGQPKSTAHILNDGAVVYQLPRRHLLQLIAPYPNVLMALIDYLRDHLRKSLDRTEEIALYKVRTRLARALLRLAKDGRYVVASRCELAAEVATSPEEVIRGLSYFQRQGLIAFEPRSPEIIILCPDALNLV